MREKELEQRQMEAAKILTVLKKQEEDLQEVIQSQIRNSNQLEALFGQPTLDIQHVEAHRDYGLKLITDEKNRQRIVDNTKNLLKIKQKEVSEAHKKVEVLKKLKEKQEKEYYKQFLDAEIKEIDDITSARFNIE